MSPYELQQLCGHDKTQRLLQKALCNYGQMHNAMPTVAPVVVAMATSVLQYEDNVIKCTIIMRCAMYQMSSG